MSELLADLFHEFRRHRDLAERAMSALDDTAFFARPGDQVNAIATIVKHLAGNLSSRWSNFLTTDGDKPSRDRDGEFIVTTGDSRAALMAAWDRGWKTLFDTMESLTPSDLAKTITIRGEPHSVQQALVRGLTHAAYHTGQILYLARLLAPDSTWLTIPPGQSRGFPATYRPTR